MQALHGCSIVPSFAFHGSIVKAGKAQDTALIHTFINASGLSTNSKFVRGTASCHPLLRISSSSSSSSPSSSAMPSVVVESFSSSSSSSFSSSSSSLSPSPPSPSSTPSVPSSPSPSPSSTPSAPSSPLPSPLFTSLAPSSRRPSPSSSMSSAAVASSSSTSSPSSSSSSSSSSPSSSSPSLSLSSQHKDTLSDSTDLASKQEDTLSSHKDLAEMRFRRSEAAARILLILVPMFWGTYGPTIRYVYEQPDPPLPSILTLARKALSLAFFFCFLPMEASTFRPQYSNKELGSQVKKDSFKLEEGIFSTINQLPGFLTDVLGVEWFAAIELGLWTFLGTACQTDGLENTTATRAGFLLQSITVLVPVLSTFSGVKVKPATWVATILALLGVTSMSLHLQHDTSVLISWSTVSSSLDISRGDLEILLAAFFYALCTVRLGEYAASAQAVRLSTNLMVVSTILAALWVLFDLTGALAMDFRLPPSSNTVLAIIFSALVPGTLASLGQTIAQKTISAAEAQVSFTWMPQNMKFELKTLHEGEVKKESYISFLSL